MSFRVTQTAIDVIPGSQDKRAVEAYKAEIKAKLTRAGLIRGQPRTTFRSQTTTPVVPSQTRPAPYHRVSAPDISTSSASSSSSHQYHPTDYDSYHHFMPSLAGQHHRQSQEPNMIPGVPGMLLILAHRFSH